MEQSSSFDETTVRHQYDALAKKVLKRELINWQKQNTRWQKREILMSELSEVYLDRFFVLDEYKTESFWFRVLNYDIAVKDALLAEAIQSLSEKKRNVILLFYFMDMTETEIAHELNLVRSTIHEHRKRSLELLKHKMKGRENEK